MTQDELALSKRNRKKRVCIKRTVPLKDWPADKLAEYKRAQRRQWMEANRARKREHQSLFQRRHREEYNEYQKTWAKKVRAQARQFRDERNNSSRAEPINAQQSLDALETIRHVEDDAATESEEKAVPDIPSQLPQCQNV